MKSTFVEVQLSHDTWSNRYTSEEYSGGAVFEDGVNIEVLLSLLKREEKKHYRYEHYNAHISTNVGDRFSDYLLLGNETFYFPWGAQNSIEFYHSYINNRI